MKLISLCCSAVSICRGYTVYPTIILLHSGHSKFKIKTILIQLILQKFGDLILYNGLWLTAFFTKPVLLHPVMETSWIWFWNKGEQKRFTKNNVNIPNLWFVRGKMMCEALFHTSTFLLSSIKQLLPALHARHGLHVLTPISHFFPLQNKKCFVI